MRLKATLTTITILFLFTLSLQPAIVFNETGKGYGDGGDGEKATAGSAGSSQIETLIILAAGHFIKSHSDFQLFLEKVELSGLYGVNFDELRCILNDLILSMESASATYYVLIQVADITPYNPYVIELLKNFDYAGFQVENGLTREIFEDVESFLSKGDITGTYIKMYHETLSLLYALYAVKNCTDENSLPKVKNLWKVAQMYSNSHFFGQYCTQVFCEILCN